MGIIEKNEVVVSKEIEMY